MSPALPPAWPGCRLPARPHSRALHLCPRLAGPADAAKSAVESEGCAAAAAATAAADEDAAEGMEGMDEDEAAEILSAMLGLAPPSERKKGKKKVRGAVWWWV